MEEGHIHREVDKGGNIHQEVDKEDNMGGEVDKEDNMRGGMDKGGHTTERRVHAYAGCVLDTPPRLSQVVVSSISRVTPLQGVLCWGFILRYAR